MWIRLIHCGHATREKHIGWCFPGEWEAAILRTMWDLILDSFFTLCFALFSTIKYAQGINTFQAYACHYPRKTMALPNSDKHWWLWRRPPRNGEINVKTGQWFVQCHLLRQYQSQGSYFWLLVLWKILVINQSNPLRASLKREKWDQIKGFLSCPIPSTLPENEAGETII